MFGVRRVAEFDKFAREVELDLAAARIVRLSLVDGDRYGAA